MDLTEFVRNVLVSVNAAVDLARDETSRDIHFTQSEKKRTVEFDIAVSAEDTTAADGKAGIRVLKFVEAGGKIEAKEVNSTVSRISFGVDIETRTREEQAQHDAEVRASMEENHAKMSRMFNIDDRY